MNDFVLKIATAGLSHDIGKIIEERLEVSREYFNNNAGLYQPFFNGHYSHKHAVYTAAFIEQFEQYFPSALNRENWGLESSFINLAAKHHLPETSLEWIIAMADRISSGWDRNSFENEYNKATAWKDYRKTRLIPIFERLLEEERGKKSGSEEYVYAYPLDELSPLSVFPGTKADLSPPDNNKALEEYEKLCTSFAEAFKKLKHREESLDLWLQHFDSLMMLFTSSIPAARAGKIIPDVSLYDHSRITAALAVALYLYHQHTDTMEVEKIKASDEAKFLMISGDFYGIQDFIFSDGGEAGRNRSKILRGRSFAVSLFSELAADLLCRKIGIPVAVSTVLNAAGKFTIIAPNIEPARQAVTNAEAMINEWLLSVSYGENSIGIAAVEASPDDFRSGKFSTVWDRLKNAEGEKKCRKFDLNRFGGVCKTYLDSFRNDLHHALCPFCGKRPSSPEAENWKLLGDARSACKVCRDHIFIGTRLVKHNRIAIITTDAELHDKENALLEPVFGRYQISFLEGDLSRLAGSGKLLRHWDISIDNEGKTGRDITARFLNGYVPVFAEEDLHDERILHGAKSDLKKEELIDQIREQVPKTFGHIAAMALTPEDKGYRGIEALGILKADVDQLGYIMSCGLKEKDFTVSRLATLSRQLNFFFAVYLPYLLKTDMRFANIYTVFAGGDDLFLIGPWNRIVELALFLEEKFAAYVCHNEKIHFSAGITLHKAHTPLPRFSEAAEASLEASKDSGRNRITLFGETAEWQEFRKLQEVKSTLQEWHEREILNSAMLYRLNGFIRMAAMEKQLFAGGGDIHLEDMECLKWHALLQYSLERNIGKGKAEEMKREMKAETAQLVTWLKEYGSKLKMVLWDILYNNR